MEDFSMYSEGPPLPIYGALDAGYDAEEAFITPPAKRHRGSSDASITGPGHDRRSSAQGSPAASRKPSTAEGGLLPRGGRSPPGGQVTKGGSKGNLGTSVGRALGDATGQDGSTAAAATAATGKSKRVRTGCLTCRERHLKCDEGTPDCLNCRKSNRECKRGIRLNFLDTKCEAIPYVSPTSEWKVSFQDESRQIASEYRGGEARYPVPSQTPTPPREPDALMTLQQLRPRPMEQGLPPLMGDAASRSSAPYYAAQQHSRALSMDQGMGPGHNLMNAASRKSSDAFLALGASSAGMGGGNFSLTSMHDQFNLKDEAGPRTHAYKSSDVSSVASSMVPQGVGPPSTASFPAAAAGGSGPGQPNPADGGMGGGGPGHGSGPLTPPSDKAAGSSGEKEYLNSADEIQYMQVFVDEVGVWMDSLDKDKHFSRVIPYLALKSPMLLNAFLACGVKHLVNRDRASRTRLSDDKALFYYDTATTQLLRSLQNPDRNMHECATTAVVLNVYEIMSEKPTARMNHIAGARALIRECGWNASSTGIGAACFWLNIGMEVLSCLSFNWATSWDPDQWGLDLSFLEDVDGKGSDVKTEDAEGAGNLKSLLGGGGEEESWVHRIFYIVAKIANFKANIPKFQEPSPHDEQVRQQTRFAEWKRLKGLCDSWNNNCPRSMRPLGYVCTTEPSSKPKSSFPNIWLIKRAAIIGRLYYHTAMVLLHQINPLESTSSHDNKKAQLHHAHQVCGIVAHTHDRGVASVAIRSLAIAACVLTERREQDEVQAIFARIKEETGWDLGKVHIEIQRAWGQDKEKKQAQQAAQQQQQHQLQAIQQQQRQIQQAQQQQQQHQAHQQQQQSNAAASMHFRTSMSGPSMSIPLPPTTTSGMPSGSYLSTAPSPSGMTTISAGMLPIAAPAPQKPQVNPLLVQADFSLPNHPYQNWYEPPNRTNPYNPQGLWFG